MGEPRKRLTRLRYDRGPMGFLADQIIIQMQRAGYPASEFNLFRSPAEQNRLFEKGRSKAQAFDSAHQFCAASDLIHEKYAWFAGDDAPPGDLFWDRLWDCAQVVSEKFRVEFEPRISWDPAHIELSNWRDFRAVVGRSEPKQIQLDWYFQITLPAVWRQHQNAKQSSAA